jgi:hypothetical protein
MSLIFSAPADNHLKSEVSKAVPYRSGSKFSGLGNVLGSIDIHHGSQITVAYTKSFHGDGSTPAGICRPETMAPPSGATLAFKLTVTP